IPAATSTTTVAIADGQSHAGTIAAGPLAGTQTLTFDSVLAGLTFGTPSAQLALQYGPGGDSVSINGLDAGFHAGIVVTGGTGTSDGFAAATPLSLNGSLTLDSAVEIVNLSGDVSATLITVP